MTVSKKSWHYRLVKYWTPEKELVNGELKSKNICSYFWEVFFLITLGMPMFAILATVLFVALSPCILCEYMGWLDKPKDTTPKEPKTLVGKWLKAKKNKVCPVLKWTD